MYKYVYVCIFLIFLVNETGRREGNKRFLSNNIMHIERQIGPGFISSLERKEVD